MILPMIKYLEAHGVQFHYNIKVMNVEFDLQPGRKQASRTWCCSGMASRSMWI